MMGELIGETMPAKPMVDAPEARSAPEEVVVAPRRFDRGALRDAVPPGATPQLDGCLISGPWLAQCRET
jgi:hypothetical protein